MGESIVMWGPDGPVDITKLGSEHMSLNNLANLRHVTRAWDIAGVRGFSVTDHTYITTLICARLLRDIPVSDDFKSRALVACMFHDCEEAFMGDIATPLKNNMVGAVGDEVRKTIFSSMHLPKLNELEFIVKFCDICSLVYEIKISGYPHYDRLFTEVLREIVAKRALMLVVQDIKPKHIIETLEWIGLPIGGICWISYRIDELMEESVCGK